MQKLLATFLMLFVFLSCFSQIEKPAYPRTIVVTGSAETEVIPDEIYVQVQLKEYEKKGSGKIGIEKIKQEFLTAVKGLGIPDSLISIAGYDGYNGNPWLRKKNKKEELYASINYQIKLKNSKQVDELVDRLDDNATQNFFIQRTATSKMAELRKNLKAEAVRAAKEKAAYLAAAIDEKIGEAVTINEPAEYFVPYVQNFRVANKAMVSEVQQDMADDGGAPVDFKKIKLKYDVTVVFALK